MGKMSDLDLQIKELRSCGETIIGIANTLAGMFSSGTAEDTPPKAGPKEKPKTPAFEEVRHRMTVIAQAGDSAEVKALITKYGARKLSDIDPSRYEELLKEAASRLKHPHFLAGRLQDTVDFLPHLKVCRNCQF